MNHRKVNSAFISLFCQALIGQLGQDNLAAVLEKASLPPGWAQPESFQTMNLFEAARAYAGLQQAMRTYYGRGARGVLMRVGSNMWQPLLKNASLGRKVQTALIRRLPLEARRKPTLEMLADFLSVNKGDVTVHTLDLNLLLADHISPGTIDITDDERICFVTQGLIREALFWATGFEHDITETSCRALGEEACEFTITVQG
ncbi:MAG: hypothetical protein Kow002_20000 [Anaerolineales bacterium]